MSLRLGEQARDFLQARRIPVAWHTYAMPHSVCLEEIAAIGAWLNATFSRIAQQTAQP